MKSLLLAVAAALAFPFVLTASSPPPALIPAPKKLQISEGTFRLSKRFTIVSDSACKPAAEMLAARLRVSTGYPVSVQIGNNEKSSKEVLVITTDRAKKELGREGYTLEATPRQVIIRANEPAGAFYGAQTFLQLLPAEVYGKSLANKVRWQIPCVQIEDSPRFQWRGVMLDVARHFFTKEEVKAMLDTLAAHKGNSFHWHLVDDHGWRIQINKYPKLTEVGAWRSGVGFGLDPKDTTAYGKDGRYGGFYTQEDIKEVIAYARERHINIVPEIEMPGHAIALLAAYPQYSCSGQPYSTDVPAGVHAGVFCAGKEETFAFLEDILGEVIDLFPSKYIHIGGDEVPKDNWKKCEKCQARMKAEGLKDEHELQSYFVRRIEKFLSSRQRNLVGWSEIREGGLAQNAAVMDWIGGATQAASAGHDVIMSPTRFCYLDYYQSGVQALEPKAIGGYLPLEKVYSFEPIPADLPAQSHKHILGAQGNIWTEYIPSFKQVEYMAFPRLAALLEIGWSPKESRSYSDFQKRLETQYHRYEQMGVNHRRDSKTRVGTWEPAKVSTTPTVLEWDVTHAMNGIRKAGANFAYTKGAHGVRIQWAALVADGKEVSRDAHAGFAGAAPSKPGFLLEMPSNLKAKRLVLRAQLAGDGGTDSNGEVTIEVRH